jgi:hypothetical protein
MLRVKSNAMDVKSFDASGAFTAGTGKYADIGGDLTFLLPEQLRIPDCGSWNVRLFCDLKAK